MIDQIVEYILQNRNTYSREAIDSQLEAAGYPQNEIEAAWSQVAYQDTLAQSGGQVPYPPSAQVQAGWGDTDYQPPKKTRVINQGLFWGVLFGFIVLSYGLPILFGYLAGISQNTQIASFLGWSVLGSFLLLQLVAVIWGVAALQRNRPLAFGLIYGVVMTVVVLPFAALFLVLGICLTGMVRL